MKARRGVFFMAVTHRIRGRGDEDGYTHGSARTTIGRGVIAVLSRNDPACPSVGGGGLERGLRRPYLHRSRRTGGCQSRNRRIFPPPGRKGSQIGRGRSRPRREGESPPPRPEGDGYPPGRREPPLPEASRGAGRTRVGRPHGPMWLCVNIDVFFFPGFFAYLRSEKRPHEDVDPDIKEARTSKHPCKKARRAAPWRGRAGASRPRRDARAEGRRARQTGRCRLAERSGGTIDDPFVEAQTC